MKWESERFQAYCDCFFSIIATLMVTAFSTLEEEDREVIRECEATNDPEPCNEMDVIFLRVRDLPPSPLSTA